MSTKDDRDFPLRRYANFSIVCGCLSAWRTWLKLIYGFSADAIRCYQCLERPQSHERHLSCSYFDKLPKFHTDCEHSTFCLKRASYLQLNNGSKFAQLSTLLSFLPTMQTISLKWETENYLDRLSTEILFPSSYDKHHSSQVRGPVTEDSDRRWNGSL